MRKILSILMLIPLMVLAHSNASGVIGGFGAPIYFNKYDCKKLEMVINNKNTKVVKIMAPSGKKKLAQKIQAKLDQSKVTTLLCVVDLKDTATTKYRKDVVLIQYFSDSAPSCD